MGDESVTTLTAEEIEARISGLDLSEEGEKLSLIHI